MNVFSSQVSKDQLRELVEAEKVEMIWETRRDVAAYCNFKNVVDIGISVALSDLPFERAMIFSWIKGELDGRKTRI